MHPTLLKILSLSAAVFLLGVASLPSVVYFVFTVEEFNFADIGNSSCEATVDVNISQLFESVDIEQGGDGAFGLSVPVITAAVGEVVQLSPFALRKAMKIMKISEWPPPGNVSISTAQILGLYGLLSSPLTLSKEEMTCNEDLKLNEDSQCCYLSCYEWNLFSETWAKVDIALFGIGLILGGITIVSATISIFAIKTRQKFPHIAIAWYIMFSTVTPTLVEAITRIVGRENSVCCGKEDLLEASLASTNGCFYSVFQAMIHRVMYNAAVLWCSVGFINVWLAICLQKGRLFIDHKNKIHAIELSVVWGSTVILALIPFMVDGAEAYGNSFLCYNCPSTNSKFEYYTFIVSQQVGFSVTAVCGTHLLYTLKKQSTKRKELLAEGGNKIPQSSVRQLEAVERRFLILISVICVISLFLLVDYFVLSFLGSELNVQQIIRDYFFCAFLHPDKECSRGPTLQKLQFTHVVIYRLTVIFAVLGQVFFFCAAKDFRTFWKTLLVRCVSCGKKKQEESEFSTSSGKRTMAFRMSSRSRLTSTEAEY